MSIIFYPILSPYVVARTLHVSSLVLASYLLCNFKIECAVTSITAIPSVQTLLLDDRLPETGAN